MKLLFAGDFVYKNTDILSVSEELHDKIESHDYRIINFEGPIADKNRDVALYKVGSHVCNDSNSINEIKKIGFNIAALSNNHIMDFGVSALERTINYLHENNIKTVGAGFCFENVYSPIILEKESEKIAIFNLCQAEFGVFKNQDCKAGYAWINHLSIEERIKEAKRLFSRVIIFSHAGLEEVPYPLPEWQQKYHDFIDAGADIVIGNHPHMIQGKEHYKDSVIFYSLGNLFFNLQGKEKDFDWNTSYMVSLNTENMVTEVIPVKNTGGGTLEIEDKEKFQIIFNNRSVNDKKLEKIANDLAELTWIEYYKSYYLACVPAFSRKHVIKYILFCLLRKDKSCFLRINETMLLHNIQNETHRFLVERYLFNKNSKINDLSLK